MRDIALLRLSQSIAVPGSTENSSDQRDPEMKQSKKGQQRYFGMKAHIDVHTEWMLVHAMRGTTGSVNDVVEANSPLHGHGTDVFENAGYQTVHKRADARPDMTRSVFMKPSKRKALDRSTPLGEIIERIYEDRASIRAKVEPPFRLIKRQCGHVKVHYRGLTKNTAQLHTLSMLSHLWMARRKFCRAMASVRVQHGETAFAMPKRSAGGVTKRVGRPFANHLVPDGSRMTQ